MNIQDYLAHMKQAVAAADHIRIIELMAKASQERNPLLLQALAAIRARPLPVA